MRVLGRTLARVGGVVLLFSTLLAVAPSDSASAATATTPARDALTCTGKVVVDVAARIVNEGDGGVSGKVWALLDVVEHAKIWQETPTKFCVRETDVGSFKSFAGTSPGGTGTVSANRHGWTLGIQRFELDAVLHPVAAVSGFLGTFDFKCDHLGNCPGNVRFSELYFTNITATNGSAFAELDVSVTPRRMFWFQSGATSLGDITG